jgi:hypothetical protein
MSRVITMQFQKKNNTRVIELLKNIEPLMLNSSLFEPYNLLSVPKYKNIKHIERTRTNTSNNIKHVERTRTRTNIQNNISFNCNYEIIKYIVSLNKIVNTDNNVNNTKPEYKYLSNSKINTLIESFDNLGDNSTNLLKNETLFLDFQKYKIDFCNMIKENHTIIKSLHLNPIKIYEKILNKNMKNMKNDETINYNLDLDIFFVLMKILKINFIYISHKCSFVFNDEFDDKYFIIINDPKKTFELNHFIHNLLHCDEKQYNETILNNAHNYTLIELNKEDFDRIATLTEKNTATFTDIKKPFKSMSYYKVDQLRELCNKMNIQINQSNGKSKTKQSIYTEIENKLISNNFIF